MTTELFHYSFCLKWRFLITLRFIRNDKSFRVKWLERGGDSLSESPPLSPKIKNSPCHSERQWGISLTHYRNILLTPFLVLRKYTCQT